MKPKPSKVRPVERTLGSSAPGQRQHQYNNGLRVS